MNEGIIELSQNYRFGFHDKDQTIFKTDKGINENVIRQISAHKKEPQWMLDFRLNAYRAFVEKENQNWGPDLSFINFQDYTYFVTAANKVQNSWDEVPDDIKNTFDKIGISDAEKDFLAGVTTQYDSEAVYHNMLKEVTDKGVIFLDTDSALRKYPELFKKYFSTVVRYDDNKYSALNSAVWSGGSFIYIPKNVKLEKPLQSYFRINSELMGQFERSLIIVDEGADVHYLEGCTAPIYSRESLHCAVVEIVVHKNAQCRYTTVQNWSNNVINLVTKRADVYENGLMEWIDGNIGSLVNMKYPACVLREERAKGTCISIAVATKGQIQDAGAKMVHLAPNTTSTIVSKSLARLGGEVNYRGIVRHGKNADNSLSKIECDTLILDDISRSDTIPSNITSNEKSIIEHEATVSKISDEKLFYLMSRGLSEEEAVQIIVMGFIEAFTKELPMEYAVELHQLMQIDMTGSVG